MFNKNSTNNGKSSKGKSNGNGAFHAVNMISEGTVIEGNIKSEADIRVDGTLTGTLESQSKVVIGATGTVKGNIICASADVLGHIEGTIEVKDVLFLKNSASIDGDVVTNKLVVEAGAAFNGNCRMSSGAQAGSSKTGQKELNGRTVTKTAQAEAEAAA